MEVRCGRTAQVASLHVFTEIPAREQHTRRGLSDFLQTVWRRAHTSICLRAEALERRQRWRRTSRVLCCVLCVRRRQLCAENSTVHYSTVQSSTSAGACAFDAALR